MIAKTNSEQETIELAVEFSKTLSSCALIAIEGELGAGKTCFVRGLCEGLGGEPRQVSSPTFTIMQEYDVEGDRRLVHVDAYRLSDEAELASIGWDELLEDPAAIIAIEWPSRIKDAIPSRVVSITIEHLDPTTRNIHIQV